MEKMQLDFLSIRPVYKPQDITFNFIEICRIFILMRRNTE